jgi:hypothetical protein
VDPVTLGRRAEPGSRKFGSRVSREPGHRCNAFPCRPRRRGGATRGVEVGRLHRRDIDAMRGAAAVLLSESQRLPTESFPHRRVRPSRAPSGSASGDDRGSKPKGRAGITASGGPQRAGDPQRAGSVGRPGKRRRLGRARKGFWGSWGQGPSLTQPRLLRTRTGRQLPSRGQAGRSGRCHGPGRRSGWTVALARTPWN